MKFTNYFLYFFCFFSIVFSSCKKEFIGENAVLSVSPVVEITDTTAICTFRINQTGGTSITEYGVCWSLYDMPTLDDDKVFSNDTNLTNFSFTMTDLKPFTKYYVRAYAVNKAGISYSNIIEFETLKKGTVLDADGNIYHSIKIGNQTWLLENLSTTKYNDGAPIPVVQNEAQWETLTSGACCYYLNSVDNISKFGLLYNFYAINSGKLAPKGWHIPTKEEWEVLENYLVFLFEFNGKAIASSTYWNSNDIQSSIGNTPLENNKSGFTGLPAGLRLETGEYSAFGDYGIWWTSSKSNNTAYVKYIQSTNSNISVNQYSYSMGLSVRCIKD